MSKRKTKPKPIYPDTATEQYYAAQLRSLVRLMARELYAEIVPELKALKPQYAADGAVTLDSWVDSILAAIRRVSGKFASSAFEMQAARIARSTISRAEAKNAEDFQKSINAAVGINIKAILRPAAVGDYIQASIAENVSLIKSVPEKYFQRVESVVLEGMKSGLAPTSIAKQIQSETGVTYNRAKFIARDQMAKVNSDLTRKRQLDAGIDFYRSVDADDVRVSGNPAGRYPHAKIKCWRISRQDIGYGPGVYTVKDGATYAGLTNLHPGKHHPNCFPGFVSPNLVPGVRRLYKRPYLGRFIEIRTSLGDRIVTTPNHPILTESGWIGAELLKVGDNLLGVDSQALLISQVKGDEAKTSFVYFFDAMRMKFGLVSANGMSSDFHGDGVIDKQVDIVDIDRELRIAMESMGIKDGMQFDFTSAVCDSLVRMFGDGVSDCLGMRAFGAPDCIVSGANALHSLLYGHLAHADEVCLSAASYIYSILFEDSCDYISGDPKVICYSKDAVSSDVAAAKQFLIEVDRIVCGSAVGKNWYASLSHSNSDTSVGKSEFFGDLRKVQTRVVEVLDVTDDLIGVAHVYNLETMTGWYNIDNTTVKNCRCVAISLIPGVNYDPPEK